MNILRIEGELAGWSKREEEFKAQLTELEDKKKSENVRFLTLADELQALEEEDGLIGEEISRRVKALDMAREEVINLRAKKSEAQSRLDSIDLITQNIETRRFSIEVDIASASDDINRLTSKCSELAKKEIDAQADFDKLSDEVFDTNRKYHDANRKSGELKTKYNEMSTRLGEKQGRRIMLEEMEKGLEGYARSVRDLLKAKEDGKFHGSMLGVLSKLINVEKKYTTAVETALGNAMQNIVVNTEEDAKRAIEFLKENRMGRVTFLPISSQEGRRLDNEDRIMANDGAVSIASDVVECDSSIKNVIEALLGRTVIMENMDSAIKLAKATHYKFKIVTLAGELLQPGGSITGGSVNKTQALLGRKDEIERLNAECDKLAKETEELEDKIDELTDIAEDCRDKEAKLREKLSESENNLMKIKAEADAKKSLLEMANSRLEKLNNEKIQISTQQTDTVETKKKLREVLEGSDDLIAKAEEIVRTKQDSVREVTIRREEHSVKVIDKKMEINSAQKDVEVAQQRIDDVKHSIMNSQSDYKDRLDEKQVQENLIVSLEKQIEDNVMRHNQHSIMIDALKEEIKTRLSGKTGSDSELEKLREENRTLNEKILALQGEVVRVETRKNKIDDDIESAARRLWDDYELTYNTALELKKDIGSLTEAQKTISSLKNSIRALGNINVDAIEEYKEVKERYEFLTNQVNDMEKAKADLEKLIGEMMEVMREQFAEKFQVINQLFGKSFVELFGGGKAEVKLLNPLDTLESPIEIEVQPPGKKLQSITLLSGGEHALTAIALLFALLQVSPAPFLVLDEIEAALDDENVYRFADYIRNYGNNTQFVVITHRRGTMEAADILYGVTMQERGVSRLLSMKLEDVAFEE